MGLRKPASLTIPPFYDPTCVDAEGPRTTCVVRGLGGGMQMSSRKGEV